MSARQVTRVAASVRQKLLNLSKQREENFVLILRRFAFERLLFRLSLSEHRERFVLKGAMLFYAWGEEPLRPTLDLYLLGFGTKDEARIRDVFRALIAMETPEDDGLRFDPEGIRVEAIREGERYEGLRVTLEAELEKARIPLQVDIGFGDAITPGALDADFPSLLSFPMPRLRIYPRETVVAEKLEAVVSLGVENSRMKDFFDLWNLSRHAGYDGELLARAVRATFVRRGTPVPTELPVGLTAGFYDNDEKRIQWNAFVRKGGFREAPPSFSTLGERLREFAQPLLMAAASEAEAFASAWEPGTGWRQKGNG